MNSQFYFNQVLDGSSKSFVPYQFGFPDIHSVFEVQNLQAAVFIFKFFEPKKRQREKKWKCFVNSIPCKKRFARQQSFVHLFFSRVFWNPLNIQLFREHCELSMEEAYTMDTAYDVRSLNLAFRIIDQSLDIVYSDKFKDLLLLHTCVSPSKVELQTNNQYNLDL